MTQELSTFKTLDLPGGALMPFASMPGERIRVVSGRVWLTEEGSLRDAFLATGEEVSLGTRGLAVIETFSPARIQLLVPASMSNSAGILRRRVKRWLSTLWLRQFRRPVAARAACF